MQVCICVPEWGKWNVNVSQQSRSQTVNRMAWWVGIHDIHSPVGTEPYQRPTLESFAFGHVCRSTGFSLRSFSSKVPRQQLKQEDLAALQLRSHREGFITSRLTAVQNQIPIE